MDWPKCCVIQHDGQRFVDVGCDRMASIDGLNRIWSCRREEPVDALLIYGAEDDEGIPCDKVFLESISGYFASYFQRWLKSNNNKLPEYVILPEVSTAVLKHLLRIGHMGFTRLDENCVFEDMCRGAAFLQMDGILRRFLEPVQKEESIGCSVFIYLNAKDYMGNLEDMFQLARLRIINSFEYALKSESADYLLELDENQVIDIISQKDLLIFDETKLLEFIVNWVKHDLELRFVHFERIAQFISFGEINLPSFLSSHPDLPTTVRSFIEYIEFPSLNTLCAISKNTRRDGLIEVIIHHNGSTESYVNPFGLYPNSYGQFDHRSRCSRVLTVSPDNVMYFFSSGEGRSQTSILYSYNPATSDWKRITDFPADENSGLVGQAYLDGQLYLACRVTKYRNGVQDGPDITTITGVNVSTGVKREIPRPCFDTLYHGLLTYQQKLYLVTPEKFHVFDESLGKWLPAFDCPSPDPNFPLSGSDGNLYMMTTSQTQKEIYRTARDLRRYDPVRLEWPILCRTELDGGAPLIVQGQLVILDKSSLELPSKKGNPPTVNFDAKYRPYWDEPHGYADAFVLRMPIKHFVRNSRFLRDYMETESENVSIAEEDGDQFFEEDPDDDAKVDDDVEYDLDDF